MSQETEAFFVMTNMIITPSQTQTTCPEDPDEIDVNCTKDSDCPAGKPVKYGHGKLGIKPKYSNFLLFFSQHPPIPVAFEDVQQDYLMISVQVPNFIVHAE